MGVDERTDRGEDVAGLLRRLFLRSQLREPMRCRRDVLRLPSYEQEVDEVSGSLARALHQAVFRDLLADGVGGERAARRALRAARAFWLELAGFRREEIARLLGVSASSVRDDLVRVRRVRDNGSLRECASRSLPPIRGAWADPVRMKLSVLASRLDSHR